MDIPITNGFPVRKVGAWTILNNETVVRKIRPRAIFNWVYKFKALMTRPNVVGIPTSRDSMLFHTVYIPGDWMIAIHQYDRLVAEGTEDCWLIIVRFDEPCDNVNEIQKRLRAIGVF